MASAVVTTLPPEALFSLLTISPTAVRITFANHLTYHARTKASLEVVGRCPGVGVDRGGITVRRGVLHSQGILPCVHLPRQHDPAPDRGLTFQHFRAFGGNLQRVEEHAIVVVRAEAVLLLRLPISRAKLFVHNVSRKKRSSSTRITSQGDTRLKIRKRL